MIFNIEKLSRGFWVGCFIGILLSSFSNLIKIVRMTTTDKIALRSSIQSNVVDKNVWSTIHVFVGQNESKIDQMVDASALPPKANFYKKKWFSQVQQDYIVYQLLRKKRDGYFVDLAANDAIQISNTFALEYYHGWGGVVIEPNPIYWPALAYRNCTVVAAVIGERTGQEMKFNFRNSQGPFGGLVGPTFDNTKDEGVMRFTVTLHDIFTKFHVPNVIDYFSLDVEGAETFIMESFPFDQYRFNILTIERPDERLCEILQQNGYKQMKTLSKFGETLWIDTSILHNETIIDLSSLEQ
jgi:Methyltransferase FkbM domain